MKLKITVHGVAYEVEVEVLDPGEGFPATMPTAAMPRPVGPAPSGPAFTPGPLPQRQAAPTPTAGSGASVVSCPIAGTVHEIRCKAGDAVQRDDVLLVVEAMKMETSIAAPAAGKVKRLAVSVGDSVREGQVLVEFE